MLVGSFLVFLGLLQAVAADSLPGLILSNRDFTGIAFRQLSARQTQPSSVPNVPTECQADCNPILTQLSQPTGCTPPANCCNAAFVTGLFNCLKCEGMALGATNYTAAQALLDEVTQECITHGISVPQLTLPGISASNTPTPVSRSIGSSGTVSRPAQSTVSVLTSIPNPSPPPTTTFSQITVTAPLTTSTSTPQNLPQTTNAPSTSSAKSNHFFTPQFSHLSPSIVLLLALISFVF